MIETTSVNTESAKSPAWRACVLCMFTCLRAHGLTCLACLRAYVLGVPTCSRDWRAFVLACVTYVLVMMRAWHAQHWRTRALSNNIFCLHK